MRLIHTADWHLCEKLNRIDRTVDLRPRVEAVARLCEEQSADVLLVAGDLFSEQATVDQMADALRHVNATFAGFFARGGTLLAITGNHDNEAKIGLIRSGMSLAAPVPQGGVLPPGRMYLQNGLGFAALEPRPGDRVQFALMPYPSKARYLDATDVYRSREEENALLRSRAADWLARLADDPRFDPSHPTVLAAHLHVSGSEIGTRYRLSERDDVDFSPGALPTHWAYVALGHVHKAQAVGGMRHVRYPGPLDRLDFGERTYDCGVLLVDIGRAGLTADPVWLPLEPTPFLDLDLSDPDATLPGLADAHPHRDRAIVRVLAKPSAAHGRDDITRAVRAAFPRLHELKWADDEPAAGGGGTAAAGGYAPGADFRETVRQHITANTGDDERAVLLELVETFLAAEDVA